MQPQDLSKPDFQAPHIFLVIFRLLLSLASQTCCMISLTVIIDRPGRQDVHHIWYPTLLCFMCLDWSSTKSSHMKVSKSCSPIKYIECIDSVIVGVGQTLLPSTNKAYQTALVYSWSILGLLTPDIGT